MAEKVRLIELVEANMDFSLTIVIIIIAAAVLLATFVILALVQLARLLGSFNSLIKHIDQEVVPMLSKLKITIDRVNNELAGVDEIVKSVQEVSEKVSTTTQVAQEIVSSPLIKLASLSAGAKKAINVLVKGKGRR